MLTKIKQLESQKISKLRFAGFCGEPSSAKATAENWEEKRLGEVGDLKNGYAFKSDNYEKDG